MKRHQERVGELAYVLAKRIGLEQEVCNQVRTAALLHDEGKNFLDQQVLHKPGKLTVEEFRYIQRHVYYSAKVAIEKNLGVEIFEMVITHHENFDGSGYLLGLKEDEIPIGGRIIRVADYYTALTEKRSYKSAQSSSDAITIMETNIEVFDLQVFKELKSICTEMQSVVNM